MRSAKRRATGSRRRFRSGSRKPSGMKRRNTMSRSLYRPMRPFHFKRMVALGDINFNNIGFGGQILFKLSDLSSVADFTALFDSYAISKVVVKFKATVNQINTGVNSATAYVPDFFVAADYDAAAVPANADVLRQYSTVKYCKVNQDITYVLRPRVLTQVFRTAVTTGYMVNKSGVWLDLDYSDIPHYGLLYFANAAVAANQFSYHVEATYYFKCKGVV